MSNSDRGKDGSSAKPATSKKSALEIIVVTLVSAALGAAAAYSPFQFFPGKTGEPHSEQSSLATAPPNVFHLPPLVTNLASPTDTWIRLEASLVIDTRSMTHPEVVSIEIAGDFLAYLRTLTASQLEGAVGLQNLRQDLFERAAIRSGGKVTELIVRTLVIQ